MTLKLRQEEPTRFSTGEPDRSPHVEVYVFVYCTRKSVYLTKIAVKRLAERDGQGVRSSARAWPSG
jgi:hypothetical protein